MTHIYDAIEFFDSYAAETTARPTVVNNEAHRRNETSSCVDCTLVLPGYASNKNNKES